MSARELEEWPVACPETCRLHRILYGRALIAALLACDLRAFECADACRMEWE